MIVSGFYRIITGEGKTLTVFCDLCSERGSAWALVMSYSRKNCAMQEFLIAPLSADIPVNEAVPNWNSYRLPLKDMLKISLESTHWHFTCSYPDFKVDYTDYARAHLVTINPLTYASSGVCTKMEYIDIRGNSCIDCTVAW